MKNKLVSCVVTVFLAFGLVAFPSACADAVRSALSLCLRVVIPSLFPFFVLSAFLLESGVSGMLSVVCSPLMARVFRLSGAGASAVVLGMIGGYPIGADCVRALYTSDAISKREAERLLLFCNNSGPAFILGAVGCGIFGSLRIGAMLLAIHWISAGLIGFFFRFRASKQVGTRICGAPEKPFAAAFCTAVKSAMMTSLNVSAFVIFFAVVTELLHICAFLPRAGVSGAVCTGFWELTSGIAALNTTANLRYGLIACAGILGFGGICVHAQTAALLSKTDLSLKPYLLGKSLHAAISSLLAWGLLPRVVPASAMGIHGQTNWSGLAVTAVALLGFFILFLFSEKRTGNR